MNELKSIKMNDVKISVAFTPVGEMTITYKKALEKGSKDVAEIFSTQTFDLQTLPTSIFVDCPAARHGIKQKMSDNLAMTKEIKLTTSIQDSMDSEDSLWAQLMEGNWNAKSQTAKKPSVTLDAMTQMLYEAVKAGSMSYEAADSIVFKTSGKHMPNPADEVTEEDEESTEA